MIVGYIRMCTQAEDRDREKALHQWGGGETLLGKGQQPKLGPPGL